jgi:S-disulfanyl-L-cysteine oxidoreductase SoxD
MYSLRLALLCIFVLAVNAIAQNLNNFGHSPTAEETRRWESVILPDGTGLPRGSGTAVQGEQTYARKCAGCHGDQGEGHPAVGPRLVGGIGTLASKNPVRTVGSYWPYSTSVWDYIHRAMPYFPKPGSLSYDETYSVTAYVLYLNKIVARTDRVDQDTLPKIKMPNRNGFVGDPRPDVH